MIDQAQMEKVKMFALDVDWNKAFGGRSAGNRHLFRVVAIAVGLARRHDADVSVVEAGAWLHDTNLGVTVLGDTMAGKESVLALLGSLAVSQNDQDAILHCIEAHDGRVPARTVEAQIVHDADTLEKMGPLGVIRETWKRCQAGWATEQITEHLSSHLARREGRIYTAEARVRARRLNASLDPFFELA
ncbi:MAG: HD domain-containing protein, partial [Nanoarchaeota archaeon]